MKVEYCRERRMYLVSYACSDEGHRTEKYMDLKGFLRFVTETRTIEYDMPEYRAKLLRKVVVGHVWNNLKFDGLEEKIGGDDGGR